MLIKSPDVLRALWFLFVVGGAGAWPGFAAAGESEPQAEGSIMLAKQFSSESPATSRFDFDLKAPAAGEQVRLSLDARIQWPNFDGSNPWIVVRVNDQPLHAEHLLNKNVDFVMLNGMDATWVSDTRWRICYAPSFSDELRTGRFAMAIPDSEPYRFVWDITPFVKPGANSVTIQHLRVLTDGTTLALKNVKVDVGAPLDREQFEQGTTDEAGEPSTWIVGAPRPTADVKASLSRGGRIKIQNEGRQWQVHTRTSAPAGKWIDTEAGGWQAIQGEQARVAEWEGEGYRVRRSVTHHGDHLQVQDTLANTTDARIGVMYENRLPIRTEPSERLLGGRPVFSDDQQSFASTHPSAIGRWDDLVVGMLARDDIFRVHHVAFSEPDAIGLADRQLGIPPKGSHTLEWSLYFVPGDYWSFINSVREDWQSNYTLAEPILINFEADGSKSAEYYEQWTRERGVEWQISGQTTYEDGMLAEGTAIPLATQWCEGVKQWRQKLRSGVPEARVLIYLHTEICTEPDMHSLYADSLYIDENGKQYTSPYHYPVYKFLSTLDNSYGKALQQAVKTFIAEIDADGIFVDEMSSTRHPAYQTTWDGCTAIIDPQTHALVGVRSDPVLLQLPWKLWLVDYLRENGKLLIGNNPPVTRSLHEKQIPRFIETNSNSSIIDTHLASPWGLANNTSDRKSRAAKARGLLRYGGIYTPYGWTDPVQSDALMIADVLYPITPVSLHKDVVLAEERVLTLRSGRYGWVDGEPGEVYVFDADGMPVADPDVQRLESDGRKLIELRLPRDHLAVIVKAGAGHGER